MMRYRGWHGRVIRGAHDVLSNAIQTMVDVVEIEGLVIAVMFRHNRLADEFLQSDH